MLRRLETPRRLNFCVQESTNFWWGPDPREEYSLVPEERQDLSVEVRKPVGGMSGNNFSRISDSLPCAHPTASINPAVSSTHWFDPLSIKLGN